ncbi:MAG: hypothetical protein F6J95_027620 [Leptolyngbya sp. SIO1E4]|nr:hypothetical protein [Leptolyngbya sp. SIO1E4]
MVNLQDKPTPTAKPHKFKLFRSCWVRWCALPTHQQVTVGAILLMLLTIGSTVNRLLNQDVSTTVPYETEVQRRADYESVDAPLAFLDITGAEFDALSPTEQVNLIRQHLPELEGRLLRFSNDVHVSLLSHEATRLREAATAEALSGDIDLADQTGKLQMEACLQDLRADQCILLRYAGDAIAQMEEAVTTGDPYLYSQAMVRYQAALFAFNDIEVRITDATSLLTIVDNYRIVFKTVVERSPGSQTPPAMTRGPGNKGRSPINTWIDHQGFLKEQEDPDAAAE